MTQQATQQTPVQPQPVTSVNGAPAPTIPMPPAPNLNNESMQLAQYFAQLLSQQSQYTQGQLALQTQEFKTILEEANSLDWVDLAYDGGKVVLTAAAVVGGILIFTGGE